jgi:Flp pilus assembly protein TadB
MAPVLLLRLGRMAPHLADSDHHVALRNLQPALPKKDRTSKRLSLMEQYEMKKAEREAARAAKQERRERIEKGKRLCILAFTPFHVPAYALCVCLCVCVCLVVAVRLIVSLPYLRVLILSLALALNGFTASGKCDNFATEWSGFLSFLERHLIARGNVAPRAAHRTAGSQRGQEKVAQEAGGAHLTRPAGHAPSGRGTQERVELLPSPPHAVARMIVLLLMRKRC